MKTGKRLDEYIIKDNGIFPNSNLPVLHYKQALPLPLLFAGSKVKTLFQKNGWTNNWKAGIYPYHHYHSNTHEAMAVISGQTLLLLGGENGIMLTLKKGDVIVIPAGVAHKNLGKENNITCIGGYPDGKDFDMNYGAIGERVRAEKMIAQVPLPVSGPVCGKEDPLLSVWNPLKAV